MQSHNPMPGLARRSFLVGGVATGVIAPLALRSPLAGASTALVPRSNDARAFGYPEPDMTSKIVRPITFPVQGKVTWSDTYGACRDGCSRRHEGQDLLGSKLQKLVACVDGTVAALTYDTGGNALYLEDGDGWYYAYLHINNDTPGTDDGKNPRAWAFAPGLAVGSKVSRGQLVAYLGDSGNAESTVPHCHFEIRKPTSQGVWHAQAINPKYSLDAATQAAALSNTSAYRPWLYAEGLVAQQYRDFLGREGSAGSIDIYATSIEKGEHSPAWGVQLLMDCAESDNSAGAVVRLYQSFFKRDPDMGGFTYWLGKIRGGARVSSVADQFASSSEFTSTYGAMADTDFVETVYQNVLGREADADGKAYWVEQLKARDITRGGLMLQFSESSENRRRLRPRVQVILMNAQMLKRMPSSDAVNQKVLYLIAGSTTVEALIDAIRKSSEYAKRFA